jgi:hypothetical protein
VNVDASNEIEWLFNVGIDTVDNSFIVGIEESVEYDDTSDMDVIPIEVESINIAVVVMPKVVVVLQVVVVVKVIIVLEVVVVLKVVVVMPLFTVTDDKGNE